MIVVPVGVLFLGLAVMALPYLIGVAIAVVIAPFYWAYRLMRFLAKVLFGIARGLFLLTRFVVRAVRSLHRAVQVTANPPMPSNVVPFKRYRPNAR
jgi:hypothetical protein